MKKSLSFAVVLSAALSMLPSDSPAQGGSLDATFNPGTGASSGVLCMALQPDGKIIIGGEFGMFNGSPHLRLARLNADGSTDDSFDSTEPDRPVEAITLQADGMILIAGHFVFVNGVRRDGVARLRSDGSVDTSFKPVSANGPVYSVTPWQAGKVLIGGKFWSVNGTNRNNVARLNSDGGLDLTFNPATGSDGQVGALGVQTDGKVLLGYQYFPSATTYASNHLVRLNPDGSTDTSFDPGVTGISYPEPAVYSMVVLPDDKILLGGRFSSVNGYSRRGVASLNADGSMDTAFRPGTGADEAVYDVAVQGDGKVLVVGSFSSINSVPRNGVARLNTDGSVDTGFDPGVGAVGVCTVVAQPDGKAVIGGYFTSYNRTNINRIARLHGDLPVPNDTSLLALQMYAGVTVWGTVSNTYRIEFATNLNVPRLWSPVTNLVLPTSPFLFIDTESPGSRTRFYRAVALP